MFKKAQQMTSDTQKCKKAFKSHFLPGKIGHFERKISLKAFIFGPGLAGFLLLCLQQASSHVLELVCNGPTFLIFINGTGC